MAAVVVGKGGVGEASPVIYIKGNSLSRKQLSLWLSFSGKHILHSTPFAVHYEKIRIHLRETATNTEREDTFISAKSEHLRINQIQLRFLHFNQHSITFLGIHLSHSTYKREKYTFINANIRVINIILKIIRDNRQTFKCKRYSLAFL